MLKELVLMRHAHAAAPMGWQADAERPLSPTGRAEAFAAGTWLRDTCEPPDAVLCSPAVRTRETLAQLVDAGCAMPAPEFEARIYEASLGDLLGVIEARIDGQPMLERLWLIGQSRGWSRPCFTWMPPRGCMRWHRPASRGSALKAACRPPIPAPRPSSPAGCPE